MLLLFLFIGNFFTNIFCLLYCFAGPNCHIKLNFTEKLPTKNELLQTCTIITRPSCFVYVKIDYQEQQVNLLFPKSSNHTNSSYPFIDLLAKNTHASIIVRYTVKFKIHNSNQMRLYVLIQCQTLDTCDLNVLRHFWRRFISLDKRRNSYLDFSNLLLSNTSNVTHCFNDQINQTEQCTKSDQLCWASTNISRQCRKYDKNYTYDFIYSYNKVNEPHKLTGENVRYTLACHTNNCNNNETINQVRKKTSFTKKILNKKFVYSLA